MKAELLRPGSGRPERLAIAPMTRDDIRPVMRIEALSFSTAWPQNAFSSEINDNKLAHYYVGRLDEAIVAYGGIWVILEESHVTTIAVHPDWRGKRYGEEMLLYLMHEAAKRGAAWMTLEVRASNTVAQRLYRKYGFATIATRKAYYSDNNEDALVMWAGHLASPVFAGRFEALESRLDDYVSAGRP